MLCVVAFMHLSILVGREQVEYFFLHASDYVRLFERACGRSFGLKLLNRGFERLSKLSQLKQFRICSQFDICRLDLQFFHDGEQFSLTELHQVL